MPVQPGQLGQIPGAGAQAAGIFCGFLVTCGHGPKFSSPKVYLMVEHMSFFFFKKPPSGKLT